MPDQRVAMRARSVSSYVFCPSLYLTTCAAINFDCRSKMRPACVVFESAADQWTPALIQRSERLRGRNRGAQLVVVPRIFRFLRLLYLEEVHVVDLAPVGTDDAGTEQRIVGRHLLHLCNDRLAVDGAVERFCRLEIVRYGGVDAGMDHGRMSTIVGGGKCLRERTVGVARIPIPGLGQHQALRGL